MRTVKVDRWEPDDQEYAVAFLVLSSVGGSVVGAVVGGLWRIATLGHGSFGFSLLRVVKRHRRLMAAGRTEKHVPEYGQLSA